MRLDKFISQTTAYSRRAVRDFLRQGLIAVNGREIRSGAHLLNDQDSVSFDGDDLVLTKAHYLMLHKPIGYVCSHEDSGLRVFDLLTPDYQTLSMAGRLDKDASGLLLLSDDGQWIHRISKPQVACKKTYHVTLKHAVKPDTFSQLAHQFASGLLLHGETKTTLPAECRQLSATECEVVLSEGRYHQVKRMFAAVGNRVIALHRTAIGSIKLPADLEPGQARPLSIAEIDCVKKE